MAKAEEFESYFHERAALAEQLFRDSWREEAYLVATVALDALAQIWVHDSQRGGLRPPLAAPTTGRPSSALRMNALLDVFAPADEHAGKVAVVLFAEDMRRLRLDLAAVAQRLLDRRVETEGPPTAVTFRASPLVHLDCTVADLAQEEPELERRLLDVAQHYRYPAFAYRFLRSSAVHAGLRGARVNRFADKQPDDVVDYFPAWVGPRGDVRPISLGIGLGVLSRWVRTVVSAYVRACHDPADGFDPSSDAQAMLDRTWPKRT